MTKFSALIEKLEKATGPDRELDLEVALAIGWEKSDRQFSRTAWRATSGPGADIGWWSEGSDWPPRYATSIDDAITLRPEGWSWRVGNLPSGRGFADLGTQASLQCVQGASPAIALCIAALRAREEG